MICSIHHIQLSIPIGSEDTARKFYCGILGMREIPKPQALHGRGGFWAELNGIEIHFGTEDGIDRHGSKAHVAYLVDDLEKSRAALTEKGVDAKDGIPIPGYCRFEFRDPFGNRVEFLQRSESA